jgi:enoyl-CoA hydratase/carnithine racemase
MLASLLRAPARRCAVAAARSFALRAEYEYLKAEAREDGVGFIQLNRPKALNALCDGLMAELGEVTAEFEADPKIGAIVLTGSDKAFAAGADIKEMAKREFVDCFKTDMFSSWADLGEARKPTIAAVNGFALGAGCEIAMMCDVILAGEKAKFGQPEVTIGVIPGAGGTQRLIRAVGKSKAMRMVLTGDMMNAAEAKASGLVAEVYPVEELVPAALKMAAKMASLSLPVMLAAKECMQVSQNLTLRDALDYERRMFHVCFGLKDQKEGMAAFVEKRKPNFTDE